MRDHEGWRQSGRSRSPSDHCRRPERRSKSDAQQESFTALTGNNAAQEPVSGPPTIRQTQPAVAMRCQCGATSDELSASCVRLSSCLHPLTRPRPAPCCPQVGVGASNLIPAPCPSSPTARPARSRRHACGHRVAVALVPFVIRWGADASSDMLRKHARCTVCGRREATLQHPS